MWMSPSINKHTCESRTEWKNFTSPIHNAVSIYVNSTLSVCLWVMLTSSPAAVALGLLHFPFLSISCFVRVPSDWTCGISTLLCFFFFFLFSEKSLCLWVPLDVFHDVMFFFSKSSLLPVFYSLREHFSQLEYWYQSFFWGNAAFPPSHSRCCSGIESSSGMGHLLSAGFHLLCWQVLPVYLNQLCEGRAEASLHMVPARLDPRPNLTPLQNTRAHSHTHFILYCSWLAGGMLYIDQEEVSLQASAYAGPLSALAWTMYNSELGSSPHTA